MGRQKHNYDTTVWVRRELSGFQARVCLADLQSPHWGIETGGLHKVMPAPFIFGFIGCNQVLEGRLNHSCAHGPPPHQIKVCVVKKDNTKEVYAQLLAIAGPRLEFDYEPSKQRLARAYHEAGHAVAAWHAGLTFTYIAPRVRHEDRTLGQCVVQRMTEMVQPESVLSDIDEISLRNQIIVVYGGHAADYHFFQRRNWASCRNDQEQAVQLAGRVIGDQEELEAYCKWLWIRARNSSTFSLRM